MRAAGDGARALRARADVAVEERQHPRVELAVVLFLEVAVALVVLLHPLHGLAGLLDVLGQRRRAHVVVGQHDHRDAIVRVTAEFGIDARCAAAMADGKMPVDALGEPAAGIEGDGAGRRQHLLAAVGAEQDIAADRLVEAQQVRRRRGPVRRR